MRVENGLTDNTTLWFYYKIKMHPQTKLSCKNDRNIQLWALQRFNRKTAQPLFCFFCPLKLWFSTCSTDPTKWWPSGVMDFVCHVIDQSWHPKWPAGEQCPLTDKGQKKDSFTPSLLCPSVLHFDISKLPLSYPEKRVIGHCFWKESRKEARDRDGYVLDFTAC